MNNTECPRCQSLFFTAYVTPEVSCPYCGYFFKVEDFSKVRQNKRSSIQRDCLLLKGESKISAQTIDVSKDGIGVTIFEGVPFGMNEILHVTVKDFEIDSAAEVVWVKKLNNTTKAGIRFRQN